VDTEMDMDMRMVRDQGQEGQEGVCMGHLDRVHGSASSIPTRCDVLPCRDQTVATGASFEPS